jgi:hypothetical protein
MFLEKVAIKFSNPNRVENKPPFTQRSIFVTNISIKKTGNMA